MNNKYRYQRIFLIFNHEDRGFGTGQEPTGYVKIELSEGKGKLLASVQSLREIDRLIYKVYLIRCAGDELIPVCVGPIQLVKNRAELKWEFNPNNVADSGFSIDDFNVAAILGEAKDINSSELVCPVAAYRDGKVNWRSDLNRFIKPVQKKTYKDDKVSKTVVQEDNPADEYNDNVKNPEEDVTSLLKSEIQSKYAPTENAPQIESIYTGKSIPKVELEMDEKVSSTPAPDQEVVNAASTGNKAENEENKHNVDNLYSSPYLKSGFCVPNKSKSSSSPCSNCTINKSAQCDNKKEGNIEELRQYFDKYFESHDPFRSRRKDYRWWKVGSPVQLNNLMYQCNIKTPLLFNPSVMMAHFKYRHLIVGIYTDQVRNREFIVCGVPGIHRVDDKPFGDLCRWVQVEGSRPRYGAFGYWIVYIDGKSGKLLNIS